MFLIPACIKAASVMNVISGHHVVVGSESRFIIILDLYSVALNSLSVGCRREMTTSLVTCIDIRVVYDTNVSLFLILRKSPRGLALILHFPHTIVAGISSQISDRAELEPVARISSSVAAMSGHPTPANQRHVYLQL